MTIVILEDDTRRTREMQTCFEEADLLDSVHFFKVATEMNSFLVERLADSVLLSLDHDLELLESSDGGFIDCGTGREVADFLSLRSPVCPVVIHSTNTMAVVGMEMVLNDANWKTHCIVPYGDLEWIRNDWFPLVLRLLNS